MIKLVDILNEVGESTTQPYKYTVYNNLWFLFTTDKGTDYEVEIQKNYITHDDLPKIPQGKTLLVGRVILTADGEYDHSNIVNKGEIYRVMSTVTKIIKEYISNSPKMGGLTYVPSSKKVVSNENKDFIQNQRDKLYQVFVKKSIPNSETIYTSNKVFVLIPGWEDKLMDEEDF